MIGGLAIAYAAGTGRSSSEVSVGALVLLFVYKGLAYSVSLSSFRGGPIFPAIFLGAAGGSRCPIFQG